MKNVRIEQEKINSIYRMIEAPTHLGFKILCGIWGTYSMIYMMNMIEYKRVKYQFIKKKYQMLENKKLQ